MANRDQLLGDYRPLPDYSECEMSVSVASTPQEVPPPPADSKRIACGGCKVLLAYPPHSTCVKCPRCGVVTATQSVSKVVCPFCRKEVVFPSAVEVLTCTCGMSFRVK